MKQRTEQWMEFRKGKFTGSEIWKLMVEPKLKSETLSETAKTYIYEKVVSEYSAVEPPEIKTPATEWGIEHEPLAKKWYTKKTGKSIIEVGAIELENFEQYAVGSPDGIIEYERIIEIKCPYNGTNHLRNILVSDFKKELKEYYWQIQFYLACLDLDTCDFISFDPRIEADWGFHIKQVQRNKEDIELMITKIEQAIEYKHEIKNKLK